ncbi:Trm112 family protein [Mycobacterium stomatepiae]|uniref:Trm112 family protein n=1 Tax=Mycobacterium stomatepiae TaxID=470076 RepID=UPI0013D4867F|nr:Trm112 family protein [Mycobacterium stomatepiae]MCV7167438.1 hypothetical protein [Mycobacterium stomatepiae]
MHESLLEILCCPACLGGLDPNVLVNGGPNLVWGSLSCSECGLGIPVLEGFGFFTEPLPSGQIPDLMALRRLARSLLGSATDFEQYQSVRWKRGVLESYAAFHPFNESTRALEPLLPHVEPLLHPGDLILDVWCRTGWSGEYLAARFPRQRVLSLWEGNSSVMGYRGFRYLLSDRATNLDVCFVNPGEPWPFRDESMTLLHAADSVHRFPWPHFGAEALRVTKRRGAAVFPHVHLSNSEPDPFFERGGRHLHGRQYHSWLSAAGGVRDADGWVFSECTLFNGPSTAVLVDDCETSDYNGVLALIPRHRPPPETPSHLRAESTRYAVNPLFSLSISRGQWRVNPNLHGKSVAHLLGRHPVYEDRLPDEAVDVQDSTLSAYLLALVGQTTEQISAAFDSGLPVRDWLQFLEEQELIRGVPMSAAGHRMQRFHANQWASEPLPGSGQPSSTSQNCPSLSRGRTYPAPASTSWRGFSRARCRDITVKTRLSTSLATAFYCCGSPSSARPAERTCG